MSQVSVIIATYNQEAYIGRCLKSVQKQTFTDLEIIVVNDASEDKTLDVCLRYSGKDSRIVVINNQRNLGVIQSRKAGFLEAHGEYICFVDGDDYLETTGIEKLVRAGIGRKSDVIIGNFDLCYDSWKVLKRKPLHLKYAGKNLSKKKISEFALKTSGGDYYMINIWGRLYKRTLIAKALHNGIFPDKRMVTEDQIFNFGILPYVNSMWVIDDVVYHYRFGGVSCGDFGLIRDGGFLFDIKYDYCLRERRADCLPFVLNQYLNYLLYDITNQIRYHEDDDKIKSFIARERNDRKIAVWGIEYFGKTDRRNPLGISLLLDDVDNILLQLDKRIKAEWKSILRDRVLWQYQKSCQKLDYLIFGFYADERK